MGNIFHLKLRRFRTSENEKSTKTEADHYAFPDILWSCMCETKKQQLKFENRLIGPLVLEILSYVLDVLSSLLQIKVKSDCTVDSADLALTLINC